MAGYGSSLKQYTDCEEFLDAAFRAERGVRLIFPTRGSAAHFRARCNAYKRLDRERNRKLLPVADPLHGASVYDEVVIALNELVDGAELVAKRRERIEGRLEVL